MLPWPSAILEPEKPALVQFNSTKLNIGLYLEIKSSRVGLTLTRFSKSSTRFNKTLNLKRVVDQSEILFWVVDQSFADKIFSKMPSRGVPAKFGD